MTRRPATVTVGVVWEVLGLWPIRYAVFWSRWSGFTKQPAEDCYEACHRFGLVSCHYGLLGGGVLTGKYMRDSPYAKKDPQKELADCRHRARPSFQPRYSFPVSARAAERYVRLAEQHGLTPTELALAWAKQQPHAGAVIIGTTTKRQVEECVGAFKIKALGWGGFWGAARPFRRSC